MEREAGDTAKYPTMHRNPPSKHTHKHTHTHTHTPKSDSAQTVGGAETEKSYYKSKIK